MALTPTQLEDQFVALIPMTTEHVHPLFQAGKDLSIWKWTTSNYCESIETTRVWVNDCLDRQSRGALVPMVILDRRTQEIVGSTSYLNIDLEHKSIEIGYTFLTPKAQRTHVNRRCKLLLLSHAFEFLALNRVQLQTHEKNDKSRNAIQGIGAKFEGITRYCRIQQDGSIRSSAIYSIIQPEWAQVKSNLQEKIRVYTH